jgi:Glycosyl transferases group 1
MSWPGGDHTAQARAAARRVDMMFCQGPAVCAWAAGLGLSGRLRQGRSAVQGLSARPWPELRSPRLTFTGRFRADKAPDGLVEALALLDAPPPAYLVGDGPIREAPARLVRARGLQTVVRLPAGPKAVPLRAGASVHVVPSREESWSQSAVVALGLGVPVAGTAVGGLAHPGQRPRPARPARRPARSRGGPVSRPGRRAPRPRPRPRLRTAIHPCRCGRGIPRHLPRPARQPVPPHPHSHPSGQPATHNRRTRLSPPQK